MPSRTRWPCRARYYNPATGRFLSEDPAGFAGSEVNLFVYDDDDPIDFIDPFGLAPGDPYATPDEAAINALDDIADTSMCEHCHDLPAS